MEIAAPVSSKPDVRHQPRLRKWLLRGVLIFLGLLMGLLMLGFVYENVMAAGDTERYPALGQLVTVHDRTMHLRCSGSGDVTVVLEAGFSSWSVIWDRVQPEIAQFTRVCSYDRAGLGWSEAGLEPRSPSRIAQELHALLEVADVRPPYVLVGHSLGGKSIRMFAHLFPETVAGLVFVDARHEMIEPKERLAEENEVDADAYAASLNLYRILRQTGIVRAFGVPLARSLDPSLVNLPDDVIQAYVIFSARETTLATMIAESDAAMSDDAFLSTHSLPSQLPIMVLTAESSLQVSPDWETAQNALLALSDNSRQILVPNSGHTIQLDQPQAAVDAVREMLSAS